MNEFDNPDWNLSQAATWVVYREKLLVEQLGTTGASSFSAIGMYPSLWPAGREICGAQKNLRSALRSGDIEARGYGLKSSDPLNVIPKESWADLHLRPPFAFQSDRLAEKFQPWENIRVDSASVKARWRSPMEVDGRPRYSTAHIHGLRDAAHKCNQNLGHNELISEIAVLFQQQYPNKKVPSRSTIQRHLKRQP